MGQQGVLNTIQAIFWISEAIIFFIVMAPASRFFAYGWAIRKQEFTNRIAGKSIGLYLDRFWASTVKRRKWTSARQDDQFSNVYDIVAGRRIYVVPMFLLGVCLLLFGGLASECAIRLGYEWYLQTYISTKSLEAGVFGDKLVHLPIDTLNGLFAPFPPLLLNLSALSAVAGAYLAVVQTVIFGYKTRTLLSSDLLWASFRLVIAIPLAYAVSGVAAAPLGPLVGFGLGAFPIGPLVHLLRRLTSQSLNDAEADDRDDLLKMTGVTPGVSGRLNEEGISSPQQLANTDPVSLAIRAGLSFDLVLNLVAQSQVWCFVGDTAAKMAPLGFSDARMVRRFFATPKAADPPPDPPG